MNISDSVREPRPAKIQAYVAEASKDILFASQSKMPATSQRSWI